jgi:DNA-binding NtrC family response regulator
MSAGRGSEFLSAGSFRTRLKAVKKPHVLLIDDEKVLLDAVKELLELNGMEVSSGASCAEAERLWRQARPDLAILDYVLPDGDAMGLIQRFKDSDPTVPIIILTGHATIDLAVNAVKGGADNLLTKPADPSALLVVIERSLENSRNRQNRIVEESRKRRETLDPFLGVSRAIQELREVAEKVARSDSPVLIQGETGSGKGVLAHWLHLESNRSQSSFVDLNCAGLPRDLLESELFGHDKGAFTGAVQAKLGLFDAAHKGTLFLDEIGDIDIAVQPKMLKVLEEKRFRRLGDIKDRVVDVRLIAATHRDLAGMVRKGSFRDDLYFRINALPISLPPLRERREDIPLLARNLLLQLSKDMGKKVEITAAALEKLRDYAWPGNIRELRNVLERALLLGSSSVLDPASVRFDPLNVPGSFSAPGVRTLEEMEKEHIQAVLVLENGRVESAARRLGIPRSSLYSKLKQYGIDKEPTAQGVSS